MPGSRKEVEHAIKEGVKFEFNTVPLALVHQDGKLVACDIARTRLVEDPDGGRARPEVIAGSEEILPATAVIFAFGYRPSPPGWLEGHRRSRRPAKTASSPSTSVCRARPATRRFSLPATWSAAPTWW
jgi:glutamate synthase (NADPH) small chain